MKALRAGYFVAVHIALAWVLVDGGAHQLLVAAGMRQDAPTVAITWLRGMQRAQDPNVPPGSAIFLGDSITVGLVTSAVIPTSVNFAIGAQRSDQLLTSMENYRSMQRASAVLVMIGTNDVLEDRAVGIEQRYRAILAKVPPHVPVILSGIPPMDGRDVAEVVRASRSACEADPRCRFVDTSALAGQQWDGIHPNAAGYARWIELLRAALSEAKPPPG